jgi:hypothetical protein
VYEATLTGSWASYAADQGVSLTWPVKDPNAIVPDSEDEWIVSHRFYDMKPQAVTDNVHFSSGIINKSLLTDAAVTGTLLGFQSESSQRRITLMAYAAGVLTQTENSTNVSNVRGIEQHMTRLGRGQQHQTPPAIATNSYGEAVTTLFNSYTARTLGQGTQLFHCIQLGRNNAGNANQMTIRFRLWIRVDRAYKRKFQGIKMQGAPLNLWVISDSSFSGYPDSQGMIYALEQLQANANLALPVRPIRSIGTLTPASTDAWLMDSQKHNATNGVTAATLDSTVVGLLGSLGQMDVIILCAGVNDIVQNATPVADILVSLQSIIDKINASTNKNPGCKFYIATPFKGTGGGSAETDALAAGQRLLTGVDGVIDQYATWVPSTMTDAGTDHPSYPATWSITPDYTLGVWYQAKLVFTKIFGVDPGV